MTSLAYAARNFLIQQTSVTDLLGKDELNQPMIYANQPEATIENTGSAMVVISVVDGWGANDHNTARFPILTVDIWADPTRNIDLSVKRKDADLKIEKVFLAMDKFLHMMNNSLPGGASVMWGTATELTNRQGTRITSSIRQDEPTIRPAIDDQGAMVGTIRYAVSI